MPLQQNPQVERMQSRRLEVLVVPVFFQSRRPCKAIDCIEPRGSAFPELAVVVNPIS